MKTKFLFFFSGLISAGFSSSANVPVDRLPNIILIMADDLGWGDVGFNDNGPADPMVKIGVGSAGSFRGHKHQVYEGGIRVPSLLVWPGTATPGQKVQTRMCTYDYLPTIVDLAGLDFKPKMNYPVDGTSLKPAITGSEMIRSSTIFSAWMRLAQDTYGRTLIGEQYKLVIPEGSEIPELYDLKIDPGERVNIFNKYPEIAEAMLKELQAWEESCRLSRDGKDYTY